MPIACPSCKGSGFVEASPPEPPPRREYKIVAREGIPPMEGKSLRNWGMFRNDDNEPVYSLEFEACSGVSSSYVQVFVRLDTDTGSWLMHFLHYWVAQMTRFPITQRALSFSTRKEARSAGIAAIEAATVDHEIVRLLRM
jgi:hypothetical protein